jgi:serine/threonine-protein kinase
MGLLASQPRAAHVVARTDANLIVVTREVIESEMNTMKPWMGAFVRALAIRFREQLQQGPAAEPQELEVPEVPARGRRRWKLWPW